MNSDQQNRGLQAMIQYDRETAARFGISPQLIDNTLYDAFGQRQVSTMYTSLNQYHVVMEAAPEFWQNPQFLRQIYVRFAERAAGSVERLRQIRVHHRAADRDPPGPVSGGDHFLQSEAGRRAGRCRERHQLRRRRRSAFRPPSRLHSPEPRKPIRIRWPTSRS